MIRLSKSSITEAEKNAVMGVLEREYLGMGQEVQQLERILGDIFQRPVTCVVNGTAALQLALQACGIGRGDEVLIPSLTYIASFQAISATGAKPVACDINEHDYMIDLMDAEKRMTPAVKGIMPVFYGGNPGDIEAIYAFAAKHHLRVIEDAAHAFGSRFQQKHIGSFGDITCFSFDGIKNITCGEGGCVVTTDQEVIRRIQDARLVGVEKDTEKRYTGKRSWEFDVTAQGWRYHMSNIMAAIGIEQLKRFSDMAVTRSGLAKKYDELLKGHKRIQTTPCDYDQVVPHIYVIRIRDLLHRGELQDALSDKGIQTGIHYQPNHTHTFYRDTTALPLPVIDKVYPELLTLPLHADLSVSDVEYICTSLKELCEFIQ